MVARRFSVFDNESLVVTSSSNGSLVGNPIINNSDTPVGTQFVYSLGQKRVITVDDTGGSPDIMEDDDPNRHVILDGNGYVADGTRVEAESFHFVRAVGPNGDLVGPVIKITVFSQNGVTQNIWGMAFDIPLQDGVTYQKVSGSNRGSSAYADFAPCFGPGTTILTPSGPVDVDDLSRGDKVWTRDGGHKPIRWIGRTTVRGTGAMAPVVFAAGALGTDRRLVVSPQHRMLISGPVAELHFGEAEVLVAAKHLVGLPGVTREEVGTITYTHIMFDGHEIVLANGAYSESFFLSELSLSAVDAHARDELLALFPSLAQAIEDFGPVVARPLTGHETAVLHGSPGQPAA